MIILILLVSGLLASSVDGKITSWTTPNLSGPTGNYEHTTDIAEDEAVDFEVLTLVAVDDGNATVTYTIKTQTPTTPAGEFKMVTDTITIKGKLDYETTKTYTLEVEAVEAGATVAATATATITLNVGNVGPVFADSSKPVCIQQGSPAGTDITTITATLDGGNAATYTITNNSDPPNDLFQIDETSGQITVATGKSLDDTQAYTLEIHVEQNGEPATTKLKIEVKAECSSASMITPLSFVLLLVALVVSMD